MHDAWSRNLSRRSDRGARSATLALAHALKRVRVARTVALVLPRRLELSSIPNRLRGAETEERLNPRAAISGRQNFKFY